MDVRSVRLSARVRFSVVIVVPLAFVAAACGGADPAVVPPGPSTAVTSSTAASATPVPDSATDATRTTGSPRACDVVPAAEVNAAAGLAVGAGAGTESARRSVCAFDPARAVGTGLSVGIEPAARFDAKVDASRRSVGVPGDPVPGLGDRALFFYSDADLPDGVGGVLVRAGGSSVDVTLQGLGGEARTREAAVAIARVALGNL